MGSGEAGEITGLLDRAGTLGALVLFIAGILRGWIVPRREFDAMKQERDEWKALALSATATTGRAVTTAERAVAA